MSACWFLEMASGPVVTVLNFKVVSTRYAGNRYLYAVNLGVFIEN